MAVNLQVTAPQHPIVVRNGNLREVSKAKKLDIPILKVAELRENVRKSSIRGLWFTSEKKSFIEPLNSYAKCCTC